MKNPVILVCLVLIFASCGSTGEPGSTLGSTASPIVNGQNESGWPAAGALVASVPWGYMGSFCSAALIAPRWVLTAGHCVSWYEGMPLMPQFVKFYVGEDARGSKWSGPSTGSLYQADQLVPHPDYDPNDVNIGNDIGLIRLETEVIGVEPLAINSAALRGQDLAAQVLYVGFGNSDGKNNTGSGVKRSTHMPITWIENDSYYTEPQGSGTCYGDSGGPGILEMAPGDWRAMGIVSAGTDLPGDEDPCLVGFGIYTRVDAYASWIAEVTGIVLDDCSTGDVCFCQEACQVDGSCDNTLCFTMTCSQALGCVAGCAAEDAACSLDCRMGTALEAQVDFDVLSYCLDKYCGSAEDNLSCAQLNCSKSLSPCLSQVSAVADCGWFGECLRECPDGNTLCRHLCELETEPGQRDAWTTLTACLDQECGIGTDAESLASTCTLEQCSSAIEGCFPAPSCDQPGGSCPEEMVCVAGPDGPGLCEPAPVPEMDDSCSAGDSCEPPVGSEGSVLPDEDAGSRGNGCAAGQRAAGPWWLLLLPVVLLLARRSRFLT